MANFSFSGGVGIIGFISPVDTNDTYAVIDPIYGIDGFRNVDSLSDLHLISAGRRRAGMVVGVDNGSNYYKLTAEPWSYDISDWETFGIFATGATFIDNILTITNNDGTQISSIIDDFSGLTVNGVITATTVSATTFYGDGSKLSGIVTDNFYTTGFTYNNNSFSIKRNGNLPVLIARIDTMTGLTVNGSLSATTIIGDGNGLTNIGISSINSLQSELDSKILKPNNPLLDDYLYYNGSTWVPKRIKIPVSSGPGYTLFLATSGSTLFGYELLSQIPIQSPEEIESATTNNNVVQIDQYATEVLGRDVIDGGIWEFNSFASVDIPSSGLTNIIVGTYLRTSGGVETLLFTAGTTNITTTAVTLYNTSVVQPEYDCEVTDRLVVKYSASTNNNFNTVVYLYHGGIDNYSHIHTPFVTLHGDLAGLQGGSTDNYYHLELSQLNTLTLNNDASSLHNHYSTVLGLTGGTVNGLTTFNSGLKANTISATTYQNLPLDIRVTGGTFSAGTTTFTNNTGGTLSITGQSKNLILYSEYTGNTTYSSPTATGLRSFAIGDGAKAISTDAISIGTAANLAAGSNNNSLIAIGTFASYNTSNSTLSTFIGSYAGLGNNGSINSVMLGNGAGNGNNYSGGSYTVTAPYSIYTVSYTHLTLPTNREV